MKDIKKIESFFKENNINYSYADYEFKIESKYEILLSNIGNNIWNLEIQGIETSEYLHSAEWGLDTLLEIIRNINNSKFWIAKKGIFKRKNYLFTSLSFNKNFKVGYLIPTDI